MHSSKIQEALSIGKGSLAAIVKRGIREHRDQAWMLERCRVEVFEHLPKGLPQWAYQQLCGFKEGLFDMVYMHVIHCYVIDGKVIKSAWGTMTPAQQHHVRSTPSDKLMSGFFYSDTLGSEDPKVWHVGYSRSPS